MILVLSQIHSTTYNPQIRIRESNSMDSFQVIIDKSNLVNQQILIYDSGLFKKVQFV
jgi:hypothetical protein